MVPKNPFPGMNPWLEQPSLWGDVRFRLIAAMARFLSPLLSPRYFGSVESQAYIATTAVAPPGGMRYPDLAVVHAWPDAGPAPVAAATAPPAAGATATVELPVPDMIEETYLEIRETTSGQVVTIIEVLSPTNKRPGLGRQKYERKRLEILGTFTHLVEIDLLRAWPPLPMTGDYRRSDYRILVRRGEQGSQASLYAFDLREPIPAFPVPLQADDDEPRLELKALLDEIYGEAHYEMRINYRRPPEPPLRAEDSAWASALTG